MATRSEAPDLAVDEVKRRARRRLVGAIVLALAAAVLLPLLLENEPKPLGDEVSIQIPPVDSGKFVTPLSPDKAAPPAGGKSDAARTSSAPAAPASPGTRAPAAEVATSAQQPAPSSAPTSPPASSTPALPPAEANPEAHAAGAPAPAVAAPSSSEAKAEVAAVAPRAETRPEAAKSAGGFVVQVAAFTDRYGALALARKLKSAGYPSYAEAATTEKGAIHRVRVGPYPSREAAEAARAKLKAAGYEAIVARAP